MAAADFLAGKMAEHLSFPPTEGQRQLFAALADFAVSYEVVGIFSFAIIQGVRARHLNVVRMIIR